MQELTDELPEPKRESAPDAVNELVKTLLNEASGFNGVVTSYVLVASGISVQTGNHEIHLVVPKDSPWWVDRGLLEGALDEYRTTTGAVHYRTDDDD